jgi:PadR family transcriptional regulator PadR
MTEPSTDVIQGTLDMLILKTLSLEPMHGFGISRRIEQISRSVFKVNPGSLLVALQRLERAGWMEGVLSYAKIISTIRSAYTPEALKLS